MRSYFVIFILFELLLFESLKIEDIWAQDWVVTDIQVVENETILLSGDLSIENAGNLTLRDVKFTMNNNYNGEYGIRVKPGGAITIESGTIITAASDSARFTFIAEAGSTIRIQDSELHRCGWGDSRESGYSEHTGLIICSKDPIIQNNLFSENFVAVRLSGASGGIINGNRFINNLRDGINLGDWTGVQITDNVISDSVNGILIVEGSGHMIHNNQFSHPADAEGALWIFNGWDIEFSNNQVEGPGIGMCRRSGNNRIINNTFNWFKYTKGFAVSVIQSTNNLIEGNKIADDPELGIMLQYATGNIVANNTFRNTGWSGAIHLRHASDNYIVNNIINDETVEQDMKLIGIMVLNGSNNNTIQSNHISSLYRGITLHYSADFNSIISNNISNSEQQGIIVEDSMDNRIYHNNFVNNGLNSYDDTGNNIWDDGNTGNYWSDYEGDGTTPYIIQQTGIDNHPSVSPITIDSVSVPAFSPISEPNYPWPEALRIIEPTIIENQTIVLDREIQIESGGSLTLRNVTVEMTEGDPGIVVQPQGELYLYQCKIGPTKPEDGGYLFQVMPQSVFVMKDSELHGAGKYTGTGDWAGLYILTTNALIENNLISDSPSGIGMDEAEGARIIGNTVSQCGSCINLNNAGNANSIANNNISNCSSTGIAVEETSTSSITNNSISKIWGAALSIAHSENNIEVLNNKISDCESGLTFEGYNSLLKGNEIAGIWSGNSLLLLEASDNIIVQNFIRDSYNGIGLTDSTSDNIIYDNNIINLTTWSFDEGDNNHWDNGTYGNYWSDYLGVDNNGDGIGDTPYYIGPNGVDRYPLLPLIPVTDPGDNNGDSGSGGDGGGGGGGCFISTMNK